MRILFIIFSIVFFTFELYAQTDYSFCKEDKTSSLKNVSSISRISSVNAINPDTAELIRIPVVFNVVNLGEPVGVETNVNESVIRNALEEANNFYRKRYDSRPGDPGKNSKGLDTKVEFYLADLDVNCGYTSGIRRYNGAALPRYKDIGITYSNTPDGFNNDEEVKLAAGYAPERYLNIYIVNKIYGNASGYVSSNGSSGLAVVALWDNINGVLIHELGHILGLSHAAMEVDGLNGPYAYPIIRNFAHNFKSQTLGSPFSCVPIIQNDLAVQNLSGIKNAQCKGVMNPKVKVKNYGKNSITSCKIKLTGNNQIISDFTWTGNLASLDTTWINLPSINLNEGSYSINAIIYQVNGTTGNVLQNDTLKMKARVAGFLNAIPYSNDMNTSSSPLVLSAGANSKTSFQSTIGFNNTSALLFEGYDHPDVNGSVPPNEFGGSEPFGVRNTEYFSYADMCINTTPGKHYKVKYKRFQDRWGGSFFRCLSNNIQTQSYTYGASSQWVEDSTIISSLSSNTILLTFQGACKQSYASKNTKGAGDYIILDDLSIEEVAPAAFNMNLSPSGKAYGCPTLYVYLANGSYGVPLPVSYDFYWIKNNTITDSIKNVVNISDFYLVANEKAVYGVKAVAKFADGHKQTLTLSPFANTNNIIPGSANTISFETIQPLYNTSNFSNLPKLKWKLASTGAYGESSKSLMINQLGQSPYYTGIVQSAESGTYDFSGLTKVSLIFDRAYAIAKLTNAQKEFLSIKYSLDCGQNWVEFYNKTGEFLSTTPYDTKYSTSAFNPLNTEWSTDTVGINTLAGKKDVMFKFDFTPLFGNAIYLDNIIFKDPSATTPTSILGGNAAKGYLSVYPNPSNTEVRVASLGGAEIVAVQLFDMQGRLVSESNALDAISVVTLKPGMYVGIATDRAGERHSFKFVRAGE